VNFHRLLLATIALVRLIEGGRSIVIVRALVGAGRDEWTWSIDSVSCSELDPSGANGYLPSLPTQNHPVRAR
jgi:hypothetical protein